MENHTANQVIDKNTDETIQKVDNECADVVEECATRGDSNEQIITDVVKDIEEVEVNEVNVIEEVHISLVTKPIEKMETVEEEIRQ